MTINEKATPAGTAVYAQVHPELTFTPMSDTGLQISQAGFGGYRINSGIGTHEQALRFALQNGINLIDTSSNYADGGSERLVGRVITELIDKGELQREQVVIVSKVGYLQGFNYALAEQRKQEGRPFPNLIKYAEGLDHCIHPEFLADQLTRSLDRLNMSTIDGYLLHNPEYYMSWAQRAHIPVSEARAEYYRRIKEAFKFLETEVANGPIQWYGISSNSFPHPAGDPTFTSLEKSWDLATSIRPDHHFRLVQLPMNLFETGGATEKNQANQRSTLQFAADKNLTVLINRPLNAISNNSLTRLADVLMPNYPTTPEEVSGAIENSVMLEQEFQQTFLGVLPFDDETKRQLMEYLAIGFILEGQWGGFGTYQNWRDVQSQFILRRSQTAVEFLTNRDDTPPEVLSWLETYVEAANITLAAVSAFYQEQAAKQKREIKQAAVAADPDWEAKTLSQTAVRALRSTEGVNCVLVGMRHQSYVQDILAELATPAKIKNRDEAWMAMKRQ